MNINDYCADLNLKSDIEPWKLVSDLENEIRKQLLQLDDEYIIENDIAVHRTAAIDPASLIKGPAIVGPGCRVGLGALLRDGVILSGNVNIGPSCEVKCSIIGKDTALAHFNYVGNSIVGSNVNLEAGAVIANHYNEREDKRVYVLVDGKKLDTGLIKFGAIVGDGVKIGANAVTSPGTILAMNSTVRRLELVEQVQ